MNPANFVFLLFPCVPCHVSSDPSFSFLDFLFIFSSVCACVCTCFLLSSRASVYSSSWPWTQDLISMPCVLELQTWATIPTIVCLCIFISLSSSTLPTFFYFICYLFYLFAFYIAFLLVLHHSFYFLDDLCLILIAIFTYIYLFGDISDFCIVFNIYQGKSQVTRGSSFLNIQTEDFWDLFEILRLYWIFLSSSTLSVRSSLKCGKPVALVTSAKC